MESLLGATTATESGHQLGRADEVADAKVGVIAVAIQAAPNHELVLAEDDLAIGPRYELLEQTGMILREDQNVAGSNEIVQGEDGNGSVKPGWRLGAGRGHARLEASSAQGFEMTEGHLDAAGDLVGRPG